MKGKLMRIICVGKIKTEYWRLASAHYLHLIQRWRNLDCLEVKDGEPPIAERILRESQRILDQVSERDALICLDENGRLFSSTELAAFLRAWDEKEQKRLNFIVGGPFGLSEEIKNTCRMRLSLSRMTFPHELARVMLLEQLFRAECILNNFPYQH